MPYSERDLSSAVSRSEFRLLYQPLIARNTRRVAGVEALVRWQHPTRGFLGPGAFLPAMERHKTMRSLTDWTLAEGVETCATWQSDGLLVPVSVNLSATLLDDEGLVDRVLAILAAFNLPAHLLTLEVTETALAQHAGVATGILTRLRREGVRISVDDFGTGYTSLAMLKDYTFDEIKIDQSFVAGLRYETADGAIVRAILELGHRLGLDVVAEGIEDAATARLLEDLGCDILQGYHFATPGTSADVERLIAETQTTSPTPELRSHRDVTGSDAAAVPTDEELIAGNRAESGAGAAPSAGADAAPSGGSAYSGGAALPENEQARLAALDALQVIDTAAEEVLDDLVAIAAAICGTPWALLTFIEADRQWMKAKFGVDVTETPRELAFCSHAILEPDVLMVVPDAQLDARFADNPLVTGDPHIRFYAGAPMVTGDGYPVGTLCVLDSVARTLTPLQREALQKLSSLAMRYLQVSRTESLLHRLQHVMGLLAQMHAVHEVPDAASAVVSAARDMLNTDAAIVLLRDSPGSVQFRTAAVSADAIHVDALADVVLDSRASGVTASVLAQRRTVFIADATASEEISQGNVARFDIASILYLPLVDETAVIGFLAVWWKTPQKSPPTASLTALSMLCDEAAKTVARLHSVAALKQAAQTDPLTGLHNRHAFTAELHRLPPGTAFVFIDLDHFSTVNDSVGHQGGDQVLKSFSAHLRAAAAEHDRTARWAGDQFVVALPAGTTQGAQALLARLRESWAGSVTFCAGYTVLDAGEAPTAALHRADGALRNAQSSGRNRDLAG